jgi:adenine-specific DNA-methyltransferase
MLDTRIATLAEIPVDAVEHGEIFTRRWVVDLILDLAGYGADRDLATMLAVEPACGAGAFLGPMVERLSASCRRHGRAIREAVDAIRAFDLLRHNVEASRRLVRTTLLAEGWPPEDVNYLLARWVRKGDYLLGDGPWADVDFVLGNPPYLRLEDVPRDRMSAYRAACPTMTGRADVYVGFYEVGLRSLKPDGVLAFICADRWMRNQYGAHLRRLIAEGFSVDATVTMHDVDAFEEQVSAYPAISVLRRRPQGSPLVVEASSRFGPRDAATVLNWSRRRGGRPVRNERFEIARLPHWFDGADSWPAGSPARLALLEELNDKFPPIEDEQTGTRVGIGVATGADGVFVAPEADVEPERLLPLSMVRDTASGDLSWSGLHLVNPWDADGRLVDLAAYPRLRAYFERHRHVLGRRHVAVKRPTQWYRTIDKVDHSLTPRPKLLFPDLKLTIHPVLETGGFYPHHNLYYIVSDRWDLRVLGGLLLSDIAQAFVEAYAVRMRGGTLRFQAQYLRRIRVPRPESISARDQALLSEAFDRRDRAAATGIALRLYGIDDWTGEGVVGSGSVRTRRP